VRRAPIKPKSPVNSEQDSCSYAIEADFRYQPQIG
jgi:hypothetical protein